MSLGQVNRGLNILGQGSGAATAARMAPIPAAIPPPERAIAEPKLGIAWGDFHQGFFSSLRALLAWPLISRKFLGADYFRDCWVDRRIPKRAVLAAALWHIFFLISPFSLITARLPHNSAFDNTEITWSGPIEDFPNLEIPAAKPKAAIRPEAEKPVAPQGADAFHPRQRIVTDPVHPNHPRQTLINPRVPQLAPKFLPALPNIVQLEAIAAPARPHIEISAAALAKLHPRQHRVATATSPPPLAAPALEQTPAAISFAASTTGPVRPQLDLNANAAPRIAERAQTGNALPAPELGAAQAAPAGGNPNSLIALSAAPAPPKPEIVPPAGNLAALVSISPEGKKPGVPNGSPNSTAEPAHSTGPSSASNGAGNGPVGVSISGGNPQPKTTTSGVGNPTPKLILPTSHSLMTSPEPKTDDAAARSGPPNFAALPPGAKPEQVFAAKRVYTLAVNMANLNSASGSWILHFAELGSGRELTPSASADLSMPVPMRKVDPKYPPDLIEQNVQGEVILYGIIRADGTVDSIQVAHSLDPQLDANAKSAFAQWKFAPAAKAGTPVDIEVIAHIPFKIRDDR
ncbi:MAG TPA: TonB family protein [Candidatus Methylomirabilis sp.]|nr:TonB family protein [Candidatus Methylomirabilis sp.]